MFQGCAAGFYHSNTGGYLEECVPCECNGRADTCDPHTGHCIVSNALNVLCILNCIVSNARMYCATIVSNNNNI